MLPFLFNVSSRNDFAFILISDSDSFLGWIARELKMQQSHLESCLNVCPVFLSASYIRDYWLGSDNRYFVFDSNFSTQIDRWLTSI